MTRARALVAAVPQPVWTAVAGLALLASLALAAVIGAGLQVWRTAVGGAAAPPQPTVAPPGSGLVVLPGGAAASRHPAPGHPAAGGTAPRHPVQAPIPGSPVTRLPANRAPVTRVPAAQVPAVQVPAARHPVVFPAGGGTFTPNVGVGRPTSGDAGGQPSVERWSGSFVLVIDGVELRLRVPNANAASDHARALVRAERDEAKKDAGPRHEAKQNVRHQAHRARPGRSAAVRHGGAADARHGAAHAGRYAPRHAQGRGHDEGHGHAGGRHR
jgi:hypothetical protein